METAERHKVTRRERESERTTEQSRKSKREGAITATTAYGRSCINGICKK